jgi:hypothetical protein
VQIFGDRIHVAAGAESVRLRTWVNEALGHDEIPLSIKQIPAGIEDVFVALLK